MNLAFKGFFILQRMSQPITLPELYEAFLKAGQKVSTDTRKIEPDAIFFSLKGPNFNANTLAAKAIESGAGIALVDEAAFANQPGIYYVENVLQTLQQLAQHHRRQFSIPVLAITGSNGKTTNKELIHAVLSEKYNTLATEGNLNNHIGVPLTLLKLKPEHAFAIIEMGANHQGEIDELCKIAEPDYGLITNIGKAHLEGFGGIEGVKKGKSEMYRFLQTKSGKAFVNGDDDTLYQLAFSNDKITYGCKKLYDVIGKEMSQTEMVSFKFTSRYGEKDWSKRPLVKTNILGHYNFINCLAATCVGHYFKVDDASIQHALENYIPQMNRSQLAKTENNTLILDAYNANPNSMKAAIDNFAAYPAPNKWVLLGDMFELGDYSHEEHQKVVDLLIEKKFSQVLLVGHEFTKCKHQDYPVFAETAQCLQHLQQYPIRDAAILIKGSRSMKMETLREAL